MKNQQEEKKGVEDIVVDWYQCILPFFIQHHNNFITEPRKKKTYDIIIIHYSYGILDA